MNSIKHKIMTNMTNEQKTIFLLKIPYINMFKLMSNCENKIKLIDGEPNDYNKKYNNETGKYNITLNGNQYYYNVERFSYVDEKDVKDDKFTFIDLITIKDKYKNNIHCGSIAIDTKAKKATITSLGSSPKCLISTGNIEFKYGDILFQIMINISKKENVKQIEITDNSYRQCGDVNLSLDYLKTMTHGFTHYHKYGFRYKYEPDNKILKENHEHFLTAPTIKANKILTLLNEKKIDDKTIEKIKKLFEIYKKETNSDYISVKKFVKFYTNDLTNIEYCKFIEKLYIDLYKLAGYKPYFTKDYYLKLK